MSRTLRIEYPGAVYHVQSEGNRGDAIYLDDEDRETFLRTFQEAARRSGWTVYAYALMANHYHILFQTARANLGWPISTRPAWTWPLRCSSGSWSRSGRNGHPKRSVTPSSSCPPLCGPGTRSMT